MFLRVVQLKKADWLPSKKKHQDVDELPVYITNNRLVLTGENWPEFE